MINGNYIKILFGRVQRSLYLESVMNSLCHCEVKLRILFQDTFFSFVSENYYTVLDLSRSRFWSFVCRQISSDLASTSRLNWRFCVRKLLFSVSNLSRPRRLTFKALTAASYMYTGTRRHVSIATRRAALQSLYIIDNNTDDCQGCFSFWRVFVGFAGRETLMSPFSS